MKYKINKGFTLVELLAVIAIIGILAVLVVPNIVNINKKINKKISDQKKEYIESAAELYGSNNKDLFNESDEVKISVQTLLEIGYIKSDTSYGDGNCTSESYKDTGCITDENGDIINDTEVLLTKKANGVVATINGTSTSVSNASLVEQVCKGFGTSYYGKRLNDSSQYCGCNADYSKLVIYELNDDKYERTSTAISTKGDACIIVSNKDNGEVNNWLKYGSDKPNWRVIGLYIMEDENISAKMITNEPID